MNFICFLTLFLEKLIVFEKNVWLRFDPLYAILENPDVQVNILGRYRTLSDIESRPFYLVLKTRVIKKKVFFNFNLIFLSIENSGRLQIQTKLTGKSKIFQKVIILCCYRTYQLLQRCNRKANNAKNLHIQKMFIS